MFYQLIALLFTPSLASTTINKNGKTISCSDDCWAVNTACYCGEKKIQLESCVHEKSPNWPMLKKGNPSKKCPSPVEDSAGFSKCMQDKMPKADPNASKIADDCVDSLGLTPDSE